MFEIDILNVAAGEKSGDAIPILFALRDTCVSAHGVTDVGLEDNGDEIVGLISGRPHCSKHAADVGTDC